MSRPEPGTTVYIRHKGELHPRLLVGYNSTGEPVVESHTSRGRVYMPVKLSRLEVQS